MNKKLPLLMLGSFALLLAGCGSDSSASKDLVNGSELKYNKENILAYNVIEDTSKITKANLELVKLQAAVTEKKMEIAKEFANEDGAVSFVVVKDTTTESETINKFGIYSIPEDKLVIPFKFDDSNISIAHVKLNGANDFKLFTGKAGDDTLLYDSFGNLLITVKGKAATVESISKHFLYDGDIPYTFDVKLTTGDIVSGYHDGKKFVEGKPSKGTTSTLKPDDYLTGSRESLSYLNLPEYEGALLGNTFQVFKGNDLVKSYRLPFSLEKLGTNSVPLNGYIFYQEAIQVPDDETNYTYFITDGGKTSKYITRTSRLNVLTGVNELVDFPYLIDTTDISEGNNQLLKDKEGKLTYGKLFGRVIYKDKTLSDKVGYVFNNKLEVINDYTDVNFSSLVKLEKGIFDADPESQIFYNDKEEPVFKLADPKIDPSQGAAKIFAKENRFLVKSASGDEALVVDTNGQVIKLFANAHTYYTNRLNNKVYLLNEAENLLQLIDLVEINVSTDIVANSFSAYDLGLKDGNTYLVKYETLTEHIIADMFGNKFSFKKETYPNLSLTIETLTNSNAAIIVKNNDDLVGYYRIDLGL